MVVSFGVLDFRSDLDNLIKSISDGMQGVAMTNDSHIDCIIAVRHKTKEPLIEVQLYELS
jgi:Holliday junction resolvase RusA-like endonuclease